MESDERKMHALGPDVTFTCSGPSPEELAAFIQTNADYPSRVGLARKCYYPKVTQSFNGVIPSYFDVPPEIGMEKAPEMSFDMRNWHGPDHPGVTVVQATCNRGDAREEFAGLLARIEASYVSPELACELSSDQEAESDVGVAEKVSSKVGRPEGKDPENLERDREICRRYVSGEKGMSHAKLARDFNLTDGRIGQILRENNLSEADKKKV